MKLLFESGYDSESMVDIFRDVSEAFDGDFNENAKFFTQLAKVVLTFEHQGQVINLLDKEYYTDSLIDIEEDITDTIEKLTVEKDEYGFFQGKLSLTITAQ